MQVTESLEFQDCIGSGKGRDVSQSVGELWWCGYGIGWGGLRFAAGCGGGGFAGDETVADDGAGGGATVCAIGMVCLVDAPDQCVQREPGQLVEIDGDGAQRGGGVRTFGDAVEPDDSDVRRRAQTDIDVVLADPQTKRILLGECTWRNSFNETEAVEALLGREGLIPGYDDTRFMVFSKHPMSNATRDRYAGKVDFVTAEELYRR